MRAGTAAFIDETCSVAWSTSIGELHEPVNAPFGFLWCSCMLVWATAPPLVSASTSRTSPPAAAGSKASLTATVVRPGPPFGPHTAARTRRVSPSAGSGTSGSGGRRRGRVRPGRRGLGRRAPPAGRRRRRRTGARTGGAALAIPERAGGQVMGGRVHRDQPLGTVQEQRAGQDREQDETRPERGAAVDPGGRAQAVGWGRRWRLGVQAGQGRRSVGDGAASAEDA